MALFNKQEVPFPVAGKSATSHFTVDLDRQAVLVVGQMVFHQIEKCVYRLTGVDYHGRRVNLLNEVSGQHILDFWGNVIPCKLSRAQTRKASHLVTNNGG